MKRLGLLAILAVICVCICNCLCTFCAPGALAQDRATSTTPSTSTAPTTPPPLRVKIVSSLPRTGSVNSQTTSIVNGIKLAIEETRASLPGFDIRYEDWDDATPERGAWDPAVEGANADRAIADPEVVAYIGPYNSGAAKISMPKLNRASLLMVSPANSWPGLTKAGFGEASEPLVYQPSGEITYFRVFPTDDVQGPRAAQWARVEGRGRAYVLHDRELYGKGLADLFAKEFSRLGGTVAGLEGIDPRASNYRALATSIREQQADVIYFGGTTQSNGGQLAKDLRASQVTAPLITPDGCFEHAFINAAGGDVLEGNTFFTFGGLPPERLTGKGKEFVDTYRATFGIRPEAFAIYGYESAKVVLEGLRRAGPTRDRRAIVAAVRELRDFPGALGTWSFEPSGDISLKTMSLNTVKGGEFSLVTVLDDTLLSTLAARGETQPVAVATSGAGFLSSGVAVGQQFITGLSNGTIIALIALGYTMVYGIVELINFAHGDLFMLGAFLALTLVGVLGVDSPLMVVSLIFLVPVATGLLNCLVERFAYRPLRDAPRLAPLVSAIGVSFVFLNIGLFWGGLPLEIFSFGAAASAPKHFPPLLPSTNLLGVDSSLVYTPRDLLVAMVTVPLLLVFTALVRWTKTGMAMRAVAQNPDAARLMGIDVNRIITITFFLGGALAGVAAVIYAIFNGTVFFQMGYRVGMDAFVAAVLGGIGSLPGACLGGLVIGVVRAMSDHYVGTSWTNVVVFGVLIAVLIFRPAGLLGSNTREKV